MDALRIPVATYRLQLHPAFRFAEARALVAYLHALGISDLYASPLLAARRGSSHGYDVTDPARLNPELGTEEEFAALARELQQHQMGLLLDIVPNHMAASPENPWWRDVLENGPGSPFADHFDIDWHPSAGSLEGRILLPILGETYGRVLEGQELALLLTEDGLSVRYHAVTLPVSPGSYRHLLAHRLDVLEGALGPEHAALRELRDLLGAVERLPGPGAPDPQRVARHREQEAIPERLWHLSQTHPELKAFLDENLRIFNGRRGDPESFQLLDRLLGEQVYRLCHWRLANELINYRRFFAVNDLVGLRVEEPRVFAATHDRLLTLVREGKVTGLRVDHIDGLADPLGYLQRLQGCLAPEAAPAGSSPARYVLVEKILAGEETLPAAWPVSGTTGYDFLNTLNGVFVDARGGRALEAAYARFTGAAIAFADVAYGSKKRILESLFAGEVRALAEQLGRLAETDRHARDLSRRELARALEEVTACLPVYRTFIRDFEVSPEDRRIIVGAVGEARRRHPALSAPVFEFLRRALLLEVPPSLSAEQRATWLRFVMRWQQFTGPVMAKGFEDTALYVYAPLVSRNEVGGDPGRPVLPIAAVHRHLRARRRRWPFTLNATSTHDTKRSEDVRARINVLSEFPDEWERCLERWSRWNRVRKRVVDGRLVPDANEEVLFYQTLLGAWPLREAEVSAFRKRLRAYVIKAAREAKVHTRWIHPNVEHEKALEDFVESILEPSGRNRFLRDFLRFQGRIAPGGACNALAQVLLKIAAPGVPDFYQGTELWSFQLVDPDNRGPVDFSTRRRLLAELQRRESAGPLALVRDLVSRWEDGRIKLYVTSKALRFRATHREVFLEGEYLPLAASGARREHVCAFARRRRGTWVLVAVPRLSARLVAAAAFPLGEKVWGTSSLVLPAGAPASWRNVLTGELLAASAARGRRAFPLGSVFRHVPVALLASSSA